MNGYIVVREERHIDPKHWVCLCEGDALKIAEAVTKFWLEEYPNAVTDRTLYEDQVFHCDAEDSFYVYVEPIKIRQPGDIEP